MEIQKTKTKSRETLTPGDGGIIVKTEIVPSDIVISGAAENGIMLSNIEKNTHYKLTLHRQDIYRLAKWQMGQDEYEENQRKHEEKECTWNPEALRNYLPPPPSKTDKDNYAEINPRTDKDIENQKALKIIIPHILKMDYDEEGIITDINIKLQKILGKDLKDLDNNFKSGAKMLNNLDTED